MSDLHHGLEQYLAIMGVDPRLQQIAAKVDPRRMYVLSRDEITRLGIEGGEFYETPWASFTDRSKRRFALKSVTRVVDAAHREHRTVRVHVRCVSGNALLGYEREVPPNEVGYAVLVSVVAGGRELTLRRGPKKDTSELWVIPAATDFLRSAASAPSMVFTEQVIPKDSSKDWSREIKLSSTGLSNVIDSVMKGCDGAPSSAEAKDAGKQ